MNTEQSLTDTTVSPQRLDEMKGAIRSFLSQSNVYDSIRNIIDTYVSEKGGASVSDDPDEIMRVIREKGLLQELVSKMRSETDGKVKKSVPPFQLASGQFYLHMRISNSRAFVDNVDLSPAAALNHSMFTTIHFGNQRFCSSHVMCSTNPKFDEDFLFTLDTSPYGCGSSDLLELSAPVHIEVFRENKCENIAEILGENTFDWRKVLKTGYLGLTVELCGRNPGIPSGIIELQLELLPGKKAVFTEDEISSTLEKQRLAISTADREFLLYAKRWWNEYLSYSPSYRERKVKLFASTTNGRMVPVTHFVFPLQVDFGLSSPEEAARFVSLFKVSDATPSYLNSIESDSSGGWLSPSTFLSQRQGSQCNHAALLCSLLLGFGLSSYCGIGLSKSGDPVVFVVSLQQGKTGVNAFLWDPVTGNRFICTGSHSFATVDCLFNRQGSFYA
ncbi:centrosomal protein 76kDa [Angomonas deanei]|nr:centrosomal protein 76kDa [Angomonas deanei]|eukprot:EPY40867.1 centrosomal protein 76kDa [Angomonas deanei]